jgi:aminopeptidase N
MRNYVAVSCLVLLGSFLPARGQSPPASISSCAAKLLRPAESLKSEGVFADQNIDVGYYRLDLTLQPASSSLRGSVLVRCTSLVDSLTQISLDLNGGMKVDSVTSGSARLSFSQYPLGLIVTLDRTYRRGEMVTLVVVYGGLPAATGYGSFEFASQGSSPWIWSLSEPTGAPDWWPCKDTPTDKPDSVDIVVTCPSPLKVGSNGSLVEVRDNGNGTLTYHWAERYPIATYLVSLAVADYVVLTDWFHYSPTDSMVILNYVLPTSLVSAIQPLGFVPSMLQFFSDKYGLYPFIREKYGHAQFGWGGAMEHQTMTSTSNFTEGTLAHELAHHWFGDMITCANWPSLWLNEGFATYSEALWQEWRHGEAVYRADMRDMMPNAKAATGTLYVQDTSTVATLFAYDRVYAKGAWVLQMLRHVLGDSTFFRTMRAYADDPRFRFKSATTEGFQSVCEETAGTAMGWFFSEWVFGEGYPHYLFSWKVAKVADGFDVTVTLRQKNPGSNPAFFTMPVDIALSSPERDTTVVAFNSVNGESFHYLLPFRPSDVSLDPGLWLLREASIDSGGLPVSFTLDQNFPNPFNPGTTITYHMAQRAGITLAVYDLLGRSIATLAHGTSEPGTHTVQWNGTDNAGRRAASGVYICRLTSEAATLTRAMILLR